MHFTASPKSCFFAVSHLLGRGRKLTALDQEKIRIQSESKTLWKVNGFAKFFYFPLNISSTKPGGLSCRIFIMKRVYLPPMNSPGHAAGYLMVEGLRTKRKGSKSPPLLFLGAEDGGAWKAI